MTKARLDLLSAFLRFSAPDQEPIDGANLAMCLSLFDDPNRSGELADVRRRSQAKTLQDLQRYVMDANLTKANNRALWVDVDARLERETFTADLTRIVPSAVLDSIATWLWRSGPRRKNIKA